MTFALRPIAVRSCLQTPMLASISYSQNRKWSYPSQTLPRIPFQPKRELSALATAGGMVACIGLMTDEPRALKFGLGVMFLGILTDL